MNIDTFSEWVTTIAMLIAIFVGGEFAKPWRRIARRNKPKP